MLSQQFREAILISPLRQYQLARLVGVHPSTLSGWLNGIYPVRKDDPRILKLAEFLRVPEHKAFAKRRVRRVDGALRGRRRG